MVEFGLGCSAGLAVAAIWYGPVIARHGWSFIDEFFVQHHFARYVSNKYHHPQPIYFYPVIILMLALPWTPFLIDALVKVRRWTWRGDDSLSIVRVFSLAWLLLPIVFFSFSGSKLPGYILPALPAAALLIADVLRPKKPAMPIARSRVRRVVLVLIVVALFRGAISQTVNQCEICLHSQMRVVMQTRRCSRSEVTIARRSFMRTIEWFITRMEKS